MANTLANKATVDRTLSLFRISSSFLRSFSSASSSSSASENPSDSSKGLKPKPKRKKKKNLFEVLQFLPNWGIGYHMAKTHWTSLSYEITKINLYKSGNHGKAWGILYKDGSKEVDAPRKLSGVNKRCWRYVPGLSKPAGIKAIETIQTKAKKTKTKPAETETVEKAQEAEPQAA